MFQKRFTQVRPLGRSVLLFLLLLYGLSHTANAQCTLVCDKNVQASLDENCEIVVTIDAILEDEETTCNNGNKRITVSTNQNVEIVSGINTAVVPGTYVNQTLTVMITDINSGNNCWGFILVQDKQAPMIMCETVTIPCTMDTSPESIGYPTIMDNCGVVVDTSYFDAVSQINCTATTLSTIERTWTAIDAQGNESSCVQTIILEQPNIDDIEFPDNLNLSCVNADTSPESTDYPTINGMPISTIAAGNCEWRVEYDDQQITLCQGAYKISRAWAVWNLCNSTVVRDTQEIFVLDQTPPTISCPLSITLGTDTGSCEATVNIPQPTVSDDCSNDVTLDVLTSFGGNGFGPFSNIAAGTYEITYTATDACGNLATCTVPLVIEDDEKPIAICDNDKVISLTDSGLAKVRASAFDEGSHDNCSPFIELLVARMDADSDGDGMPEAEDFGEMVMFMCSDVASPPMIVLRVVDRRDPTSFSECMMEVTVQDKVGPRFTNCPADATIDCSQRNNLDQFGTPTVEDVCDLGITMERVEEDLDECGLGTIRRIFIAQDVQGNETRCEQLLTVVNQFPITADSITWPADITLEGCGVSTDLADLPLENREPIISETAQGCNQIGITYRDEVFTASAPACYKIIRTWRIMNLCLPSSDPNAMFQQVQLIKVLDQEAPVLDCPAAVVEGVDNSCEGAIVLVPIVTATDCADNVRISNDSPHAAANGADASGYYPLGTTIVTFTALDGCGNRSTCQVEVTVLDNKKPNIVCLESLTGNLMDMGENGMLEVSARHFDASSTDNCTLNEDLEFTIRKHDPSLNLTDPPVETGSVMFDCSELGVNEVEVWATDEAGNSAFCITEFRVSDLDLICNLDEEEEDNSSGTLIIEGVVKNPLGESIEDVQVFADATEATYKMTNSSGTYRFESVPSGASYDITPVRNEDLLNGVTTIDLVLIARHILGTQYLESPYQLIAADVDQSGTITTLDMLALRKLILQIETELPNNTSWRFIDAQYDVEAMDNPLTNNLPASYPIESLNTMMEGIDFIGIKIGDVNHTAITTATDEMISDRSSPQEFIIETSEQEFVPHQTISVELAADDLAQSLGGQLTWQFDPSVLTLTAIDFSEEGKQLGWQAENLNTTQLDKGLLMMSWFQAEIQALETKNWVTLTFKTTSSGRLSDVLTIIENPVKAEWYDEDLTILKPTLTFTAIPNEDIQLYQNQPNPFENSTTIGFYLPTAQPITLKIFDGVGRTLKTISGNYTSGTHEVTISKTDLNTTGIVYYQLASLKNTVTRKMIILE